MAQFYLLNCVLQFQHQRFAGELVDSTAENVALLQQCGGVLADAGNAAVAAAAALAQAARLQGKPLSYLNSIMLGALQADHQVTPSITTTSTGAAIGDANATIDLSQGERVIVPSTPNTANRTYTLATTGTGPFPVAKGTRRRITNLDVAAFTKAFVNDSGGGGGTIATLVASKLGDLTVEFDGTKWTYVGGGPT